MAVDVQIQGGSTGDLRSTRRSLGATGRGREEQIGSACSSCRSRRVNTRILTRLVQVNRALFVAATIADIGGTQDRRSIKLPLQGQIKVRRPRRSEVGSRSVKP